MNRRGGLLFSSVLVVTGLWILGCGGASTEPVVVEPPPTPTTTEPTTPPPATPATDGSASTEEGGAPAAGEECKLPPFLLYPNATVLGGVKDRTADIKLSFC